MMNGKRTRRVLVIDDEPDMAEWLALTVTGAGYDVRVATRGAEAEQLFATWQPDAALVDLVLPDANGADLVRRFKSLQPRTEVLVVSGQGSIPRAVEGLFARAIEDGHEGDGPSRLVPTIATGAARGSRPATPAASAA